MGYDKPDFWAEKARREGYPARSVYKLKELNEKFSLLSAAPVFKVLDLGAAPGSWSLYVLKTVKKPVSLVACDLNPLSRAAGCEAFDNPALCHELVMDFTSEEAREAIAGYGAFNLILSDAAPATTGNRALDTSRSFYLAEAALFYAANHLEKKGRCAIKIFQGAESAQLIQKARGLFSAVKCFKPKAVRPSSFETYLVGVDRF
ncbi:MAG: RlmE family RNA methyltransferase [Spirochaetaceae bacterium]|nr:RlmE family RNA methyltransferase [Spirochaetaceae bacterium]